MASRFGINDEISRRTSSTFLVYVNQQELNASVIFIHKNSRFGVLEPRKKNANQEIIQNPHMNRYEWINNKSITSFDSLWFMLTINLMQVAACINSCSDCWDCSKKGSTSTLELKPADPINRRNRPPYADWSGSALTPELQFCPSKYPWSKSPLHWHPLHDISNLARQTTSHSCCSVLFLKGVAMDII